MSTNQQTRVTKLLRRSPCDGMSANLQVRLNKLLQSSRCVE